jgi:hypothetical protein
MTGVRNANPYDAIPALTVGCVRPFTQEELKPQIATYAALRATMAGTLADRPLSGPYPVARRAPAVAQPYPRHRARGPA